VRAYPAGLVAVLGVQESRRVLWLHSLLKQHLATEGVTAHQSCKRRAVNLIDGPSSCCLLHRAGPCQLVASGNPIRPALRCRGSHRRGPLPGCPSQHPARPHIWAQRLVTCKASPQTHMRCDATARPATGSNNQRRTSSPQHAEPCPGVADRAYTRAPRRTSADRRQPLQSRAPLRSTCQNCQGRACDCTVAYAQTRSHLPRSSVAVLLPLVIRPLPLGQPPLRVRRRPRVGGVEVLWQPRLPLPPLLRRRFLCVALALAACFGNAASSAHRAYRAIRS